MARKKHIIRTITACLFTSVVIVGSALGALPQFEQPNWDSLSSEQKSILAPLADDWAGMDPFRRKKWLGIAQRYPEMTSAEQVSLQRNMRTWANLEPEERKLVREKFKTLKKVEPEQRQIVKQQWKEYQALSHEDRERLREKARQRPSPPKTSTVAPNTQSAAGDHQTLVHLPTPSGISPLSPIKPPRSTMVPKAGTANKKE